MVDFLGGLIFPGIELSKNTLIKKTSLLKNAQIIKTHKVVAKNTKTLNTIWFLLGVHFGN
jgi:pantothenate kinase type III